MVIYCNNYGSNNYGNGRDPSESLIIRENTTKCDMYTDERALQV